ASPEYSAPVPRHCALVREMGDGGRETGDGRRETVDGGCGNRDRWCGFGILPRSRLPASTLRLPLLLSLPLAPPRTPSPRCHRIPNSHHVSLRPTAATYVPRPRSGRGGNHPRMRMVE